MPTVPKYEYPQVDNVLPPDSRGQATAQAFGGGLASGLDSIGKAVDKTGDMLAAHAVKMQTLVNQADADQKTSDYIIAQSELDLDHRSKEGRARADSFPKYIEQSKKLRDKFASTMSNPESRRLFDSETRKYFAYSVRNEAYGVGTELKKYNTESNTRIMISAEELIIGNPHSDAVFEDGLGTAQRALQQERANKNWDDATLQQKNEQTESKLLQKRIETIALTDQEKAVELFEKNKEKIIPSERVQVENAIAAGKNLANSKAGLAQQSTKELVNSDVQSVYQTGRGNSAIKESTIRSVLGDQAVENWKIAKNDAATIWWHTHALATTPQANMETQLRNLTPESGSPNFARAQKVLETVRTEIENRLTMRQQDPAASVADDPTVKLLSQGNNKEILMDARLAAQTRAGIPAEFQSPITVAEANAMTAPMARIVPGTEHEVVSKVVDNFKKTYGDKWDQAFTFAQRAQKMSAETARISSLTVRRLLKGETPSKADLRAADENAESDAAKSVFNSLYDGIDEWGHPVITPAPPKPKIPNSKKILDKYPSPR